MHMRGAKLCLSTQQNVSSGPTQVPFRHDAFSRTGGRKTIHLKKDLMEVLAKNA
jgi:hypothetical protein